MATVKPRRLGAYSSFANGFMALFMVAVLGAVSYALWQDRENRLELQLQRAKGNALIFEDQVSQTLQLIENTIRTLPEAADADLAHMPVPELERSLKGLQFGQPALRSLSVQTQAEGVRASTNQANVGRHIDLSGFTPGDVGSRETSVLRLGPVWQGRDLSDGRPTSREQPGSAEQSYFIPLAVRIGVGPQTVWVIAALNPDYLLGRLDRYSHSGTDLFQLVRLDGSILVSTQDGPTGLSFGPPELLRSILAQELGTALVGRLTAFRSSSRYPFFVTVDINRQVVLEQWQSRAVIVMVATLLGLIAVLLVTLLLMRRIERAEQADREQQGTIRKLSQAIEQSPSGVLITDTRGCIEYSNPFFSDMSGWIAERIIGRNPHVLLADPRGEQFFEDLRHALNAGRNWSGELVCRHAHGFDYTVFAMMAPLRDELGQVTHHIIVEHDVSAQKRMVQDLEEARDKAEAATRAKSEFLANMSHEIRTPMNGVIGMTDLALDMATDDGQRRFLDIAKNSAQALMVVLNEILDFSRIEAGQLVLEHTAFDLRQLMGQTVDSLEGRTLKKGLTLNLDCAPDLPAQLVGDPGRIRQVLTNLCDNAIKFTARGGLSVRVRWTPDPVGPGESAQGCEVHLSVTDTGIGIAPQKQKLIFEAFSQADTSNTREFGGTGLGLTISARLVDLMGGRIWVDSQSGQGSTFHFTVRMGLVSATAEAVAA